MRKFAIICFIVAILVYGIGAILAWMGILIGWDTYWKIAGAVSGLASILGLLGLAINPLKDADIKSFQVQTLQKLADTAKEIENKEGVLKETSDKITSLEIKKEELEVLVKKASLVLYYKDELERAYQRLLKLLNVNSEINETIVYIQQIESEAKSLNAEIDENADIRDIISTIVKAKSKQYPKRTFLEILLATISSSSIHIKF